MQGDESLVGMFRGGEVEIEQLAGAESPDNIFTILEELEKSLMGDGDHHDLQKFLSSGDVGNQQESEPDADTPRPTKKAKLVSKTSSVPPLPVDSTAAQDGQQRMSHITVERNRRKQMNEHLSVLRSLMPCFYVKRVRAG